MKPVTSWVPIGLQFFLAGIFWSCVFSTGNPGSERVSFLVRRPADTALAAESSLALDFLGQDSLRNSLTFSSPDLPDGARLADGVFYWTPAWKDIGAHSIRVRVAGLGNPAVTDSFTFSIQVGSWPLLQAPLQDTAILVGQSLSMAFPIRTPIGDSVSLTIIPLDSIGNYASGVQAVVEPADSSRRNSRIFAWTPDSTQAGPRWFQVLVRNHMVPIRVYVGYFKVTVFAQAPHHYREDTLQGAPVIGDFARLSPGAWWKYARDGYTISTLNTPSQKTIHDTVEIQLDSADADGVYRLRVKVRSVTIRESPLPVDTLRTDSVFTTFCGSQKGCDSAWFDSWGGFWSFHGCALPFYSAAGNAMDHFLPRDGLRRVLRGGQEIFVLENVLPSQEVRFGSEIGLLAYYAYVQQEGGEISDRITLLDYR